MSKRYRRRQRRKEGREGKNMVTDLSSKPEAFVFSWQYIHTNKHTQIYIHTNIYKHTHIKIEALWA